MHKAVILLTKAEDKDDARSKAESFLEGYGDGKVWDWYVIGGRWSGTLNNNAQKFYDMIKEKQVFKDENFVSVKEVEDNKDKLQAMWEELGETTPNPYNRDNYKDVGEETDDIVLAVDVVDVLKKWEKDMNKEAEEFWNKAIEEKKKEEQQHKDDPKFNLHWGMSGYYAGLYRDCRNDYFSFESSVYDIDEETNRVPADLTGYYAVMVDMHN